MDNVCEVCGKIFPAFARRKTCDDPVCKQVRKERLASNEEKRELYREGKEALMIRETKEKNDVRAEQSMKKIDAIERDARRQGISYGTLQAMRHSNITYDERERRETLKKRIALSKSKPVEPDKCRCIKCLKLIDIGSKFCKHCGSIQLVRKVD